jgi:hypothetical protein
VIAEGEAFAELRALYRAFDEATARVAPICRASGRCCDFEAYGHTLFASRLEVDLLLAESGLASFDPSTKLCPFWKERRCEARSPRPLGCRAYFCDASKEEEMRALHEEHLRRVKDVHVRHGIPWDYAPLLRHLADALPRGD